MTKITVLVLLLFLNFSSSPLFADITKVFVKSEEDFFIHMQNHVNNVKSLANVFLDKIEKNPKKYAELLGLPDNFKMNDKFRKIVTDYIAIHDIAKVNTSKEFLALNGAKKPLIAELYKIYGLTFNETNKEQMQIVNGIVNKADKAAGKRFFEANLVSGEEWIEESAKAIESNVDKIERSLNPVVQEEFGRRVLPTSEYLRTEKARLQKLRTNDPLAFAKAHQKELADFPDEKIAFIEKLEKEFAEEYPKVTTTYFSFKDKVNKFKQVLKNSGVITDYLDDHSICQIMDNFENAKGKITFETKSLSNIEKEFKNFLFTNDKELSKIKDMLKLSTGAEGQMMLDFAKIEHAKLNKIPYSSKYTRMFETLAGECEN